ncbi:MAG: ribosome assembly cofactor RimP [Flavobacteriales bacterium]
MFKKEVTQLLNDALEKNKNLFLIDFKIISGNQIRVIIDGDNGVTVKDCVEISRAIEHNLDREENDFSLEVASAGVSEPLVNLRQYKKNIGRKLSVKTKEDQIIEGQLTNANDETITLKWKTREPKPIGKGKITVQKETVLNYNTIAEAKVMITF